MNSIETARSAIAQSPADPELLTLERLLHALEAEESFDLNALYDLPFDRFETAMGILHEWRLARYYEASGRPFAGLSRMARRADDAAAAPQA